MRITEDARLSDRRVTEWFLLEQARRERDSAAPALPLGAQPVITISRQFGAGGHSVAERVAQQLGPHWQVWDKEIIEAIARTAQVRTEMVEALDEHTQGWMDQMMRSLFSVKQMEPLAYRHHLVEVLLALAQQGHKVIVGRGANFVLPTALNVRLCASLEHRTRAVMAEENIPHEEAMRQVLGVDYDRARFTRRVYGRRIDDAAAYDMVLQIDTLGVEAGVACIAAAARSQFGDAT